jgi:phosphomannomutase
MKNKKAIICDIDGTLAYSDTEVNNKILEIISEIQKKYIFITMGNGSYIDIYPQFVKKYMEKVKREIYLFTLGGLEGYKITKEGVIKLYSNELSKEEKNKIIKKISKLIKEKNIIPDTYDQIEDRGSMIVFSVLGRKANKELKKIFDPSKEKRKEIVNELQKELPEFELRIGGTTTIDITKKGFTKEFGIKKIKEILGINFEEMIYLGDDLQEGGNDHAVKKFVDVIEVKNPEDTLIKLKKFL